MTLTLDGNNIDSLKHFYTQLEPVLQAGGCPWGENLDSLREVVDMQFNYTGNPSLDINQIIWLNSDKSKHNLGIAETLGWLKVKRDASTSVEHRRYFERQMNEVKKGESKTLFEMLVEILSSNPAVKFSQT